MQKKLAFNSIMSITKSYNKYTGVYYAYETTYHWDEQQKKSIQRKKCIGHFDPITKEIIKNGRKGRPSKSKSQILLDNASSITHQQSDTTVSLIQVDNFAEYENIAQTLNNFAESLDVMQSEILEIKSQLCPLILELSKIKQNK